MALAVERNAGCDVSRTPRSEGGHAIHRIAVCRRIGPGNIIPQQRIGPRHFIAVALLEFKSAVTDGAIEPGRRGNQLVARALPLNMKDLACVRSRAPTRAQSLHTERHHSRRFHSTCA